MRRNCCVYLSANSSPSLLSCSGAGPGLGNNATGPESHQEAGGGWGMNPQPLDYGHWGTRSLLRRLIAVGLTDCAIPAPE